jgi:hypothetical protein
MHRPSFLLACLVLAASVAGDAQAANTGRVTYKCVNAKGEIYYSDHYVPEQCTGGGSQINDQGLTVKKIERQMTPEEREAAEQKKREEEEQARLDEQQRKSDNVLLQSFLSEEDLTRAHEKEIRLVDTDIKAHQLVLKSQERNLTDMLAQAADAERTGQAVPAKVANNIGVLRGQLEAQRALIASKENRRAELRAIYQVQLKRFRELKRAGVAPANEQPST